MTTNVSSEGTGATTLVKRLRSGCVPFASRIAARVCAPTQAARVAAAARAAIVRWTVLRAPFMEYFDMCWWVPRAAPNTRPGPIPTNKRYWRSVSVLRISSCNLTIPIKEIITYLM